MAYRGSALGRGGHKFRRSPGQGHPVRAGGKPGPSPHPMAATVGEKTSQGQVVRCWGRQGGRGSGVTRPSWHRGGACTPPPRATREAQTIRGSPRVSPRAARSLGVATACSPPGLGGRVVGAYLGLGQTFQGLHNRLLGPRGLGLQREGRRAPSVWAEPGVGGLRVGGGRAGEPRGAGWPGGGSRPGGAPHIYHEAGFHRGHERQLAPIPHAELLQLPRTEPAGGRKEEGETGDDTRDAEAEAAEEGCACARRGAAGSAPPLPCPDPGAVGRLPGPGSPPPPAPGDLTPG